MKTTWIVRIRDAAMNLDVVRVPGGCCKPDSPLARRGFATRAYADAQARHLRLVHKGASVTVQQA
ncbi:hypothetical protein UFOVP347_47 [uncultured Caudovirales phage]|uniref:Uncharacterized protein n=1 Tax=uncultured Caudovirales phage TaxID=2100421 RepID=A0A6J5M713_9CAUD|nr:hypothetical protein UFOVP347_47 [uncultured Caudovirales phage]